MIEHQYQQFQLGDTVDQVGVRNVPASNGSPSFYISIDDIRDVFKNAQRFKLNGKPILFQAEPNGTRIQPLRIDFYPDEIIEVITDTSESSNKYITTIPRTCRILETQSSQELLLSSSNLIQSFNSTTISESAKETIRSDLIQQHGALKICIKEEKTEDNETHQKMMQMQSRIMELLMENKLKSDQMLQLQLDAKVKGDKMIDLQNQTLDRLAVLQKHAEAILIQNFELHEYPIPRLFIILPVDQSNWNPLRILENKFRLHFLCECGEHTMDTNMDGQNQIHIAKHEGYEIRDATEFYRKYGKYILILLQVLKVGVEIADKSIPAIHAPKALNPGIDLSISYMKALSIENPILENINTIDDYEALEGADLRQLDKFLQINDRNRKLGNLYRITIDTGHVKWVCIDHYHSTYKEKDQKAFENIVEMNRGTYDLQLGKLDIAIGSKIRAKEFFDALSKARH
ncbi:hypothetical protein BGZ76_005690, partial [Entomortierella beljakovae]